MKLGNSASLMVMVTAFGFALGMPTNNERQQQRTSPQTPSSFEITEASPRNSPVRRLTEPDQAYLEPRIAPDYQPQPIQNMQRDEADPNTRRTHCAPCDKDVVTEIWRRPGTLITVVFNGNYLRTDLNSRQTRNTVIWMLPYRGMFPSYTVAYIEFIDSLLYSSYTRRASLLSRVRWSFGNCRKLTRAKYQIVLRATTWLQFSAILMAHLHEKFES